jgi:hypothetical protein
MPRHENNSQYVVKLADVATIKKMYHYYISRLFLVPTVMVLAQRQATMPAAALLPSPANPVQ